MDPVITDCPTCGGPEEHEVLKETAQNLTVRCLECGDVRSFSPPTLRTMELPLVVSAGEESFSSHIETPREEPIRVGDEFEHEGHRMMVTALENLDGQHPRKAVAKDLKLLHAKLFDTVVLKFALNEGDITQSFEKEVEPEHEVHIGDVVGLGDRLGAVKTIKSDQNRTLHRGFLLARNIRRVFCDPAPRGARLGDRVQTRKRGAASEAAKKKGPSSRVKGPRPGAKRRW